jgi:hypothetical protein
MSELQITGNDVAQAMSQLLVEVATGRNVKRSQLENVIDASDATVRRMQMHINAVKTMIECKKHGIDFAASMREMRSLDADVSHEFRRLMDKPVGDI